MPPAASMTEGLLTRLPLPRRRGAQLDARQRLDQRAERITPDLEVAILVVGRAGRRQQHDRSSPRRRPHRIARRRCDGDIERAAAVVRHLALQRGGELLRRLADQVGLGDAREIAGQAGDAALLRLAADDPVDVAGEGGERRGGAVGVGRLAVVDEERAADAADLLQAMRQARERRERRRHLARRDAGDEAGGAGSQRILDVVAAAQGPEAGKIGERAERPGPRRAADQLACPRRTSRAPRARWPTARRPSCDWQAAAARRCRGTSRRPRR